MCLRMAPPTAHSDTCQAGRERGRGGEREGEKEREIEGEREGETTGYESLEIEPLSPPTLTPAVRGVGCPLSHIAKQLR